MYVYKYTYVNWHTRGGGDSHMKGARMLVVSLRAVNFRFWSHLGCSGQNSSLRVALEEMLKNYISSVRFIYSIHVIKV